MAGGTAQMRVSRCVMSPVLMGLRGRQGWGRGAAQQGSPHLGPPAQVQGCREEVQVGQVGWGKSQQVETVSVREEAGPVLPLGSPLS